MATIYEVIDSSGIVLKEPIELERNGEYSVQSFSGFLTLKNSITFAELVITDSGSRPTQDVKVFFTPSASIVLTLPAYAAIAIIKDTANNKIIVQTLEGDVVYVIGYATTDLSPVDLSKEIPNLVYDSASNTLIQSVRPRYYDSAKRDYLFHFHDQTEETIEFYETSLPSNSLPWASSTPSNADTVLFSNIEVIPGVIVDFRYKLTVNPSGYSGGRKIELIMEVKNTSTESFLFKAETLQGITSAGNGMYSTNGNLNSVHSAGSTIPLCIAITRDNTNARIENFMSTMQFVNVNDLDTFYQWKWLIAQYVFDSKNTAPVNNTTKLFREF